MNSDLNDKLWPHAKAIQDALRWRRRINFWLWLLGSIAVIGGFLWGWL